jgi:hypothetical protein
MMKLGRLQMNRWIVGIEPPKNYHQSRSHAQKMKMESRYDPVSFVMIGVVEREE